MTSPSAALLSRRATSLVLLVCMLRGMTYLRVKRREMEKSLIRPRALRRILGHPSPTRTPQLFASFLLHPLHPLALPLPQSRLLPLWCRHLCPVVVRMELSLAASLVASAEVARVAVVVEVPQRESPCHYCPCIAILMPSLQRDTDGDSNGWHERHLCFPEYDLRSSSRIGDHSIQRWCMRLVPSAGRRFVAFAFLT